MATSSIEWTDKVWNPVRGCVKVSAGCKHCYAETFAERWRGVKGHAYEQGFDLRLAPHKLEEPVHWKEPRKVFVNSMSDLFQVGVPFEYIDKVFTTMARAPRHTFQILTKRPDRMLAYMKRWLRDQDGVESPAGAVKPLANVWLGVSVEDQAAADIRIPLLLKTPAAVRWISAEPLLGPLDLKPYAGCFDGNIGNPSFVRWLDWIVIGGESGHSARPFCIDWADDILRQVRGAGIPVFMKQFGRMPVTENINRWDMDAESIAFMRGAAGAEYKLQDPKGGDMAEWPEEFRVREFPAAVL